MVWEASPAGLGRGRLTVWQKTGPPDSASPIKIAENLRMAFFLVNILSHCILRVSFFTGGNAFYENYPAPLSTVSTLTSTPIAVIHAASDPMLPQASSWPRSPHW